MWREEPQKAKENVDEMILTSSFLYEKDIGKAMNANTYTFQNSWIRQLGQYNSHFTHQNSSGVGDNNTKSVNRTKYKRV